MALIELFSKSYYPQLRAYTLLLAGLLAGGSLAVNWLGSDDEQSDNKQEVLWSHATENFWEKSPIKVKKGDVLILQASGSYLMDVEAFLGDPQKRKILTCGINGLPQKQLSDGLKSRLLYSRARYGQLLLQVASANALPKRIPDKFYVLQEGENEIEVEESGTLWFATNQPIFYPYKEEDWQVFKKLFPSTPPLESFKKEKSEPFFDNNFGALILMIKMRK